MLSLTVCTHSQEQSHLLLPVIVNRGTNNVSIYMKDTKAYPFVWQQSYNGHKGQICEWHNKMHNAKKSC